MKILKIKSDNCKLSISEYFGVRLNGLGLSNILKDSLPNDLENYKDYDAEVCIEIKIKEIKEIEVETEGYVLELKSEDDEREGDSGDE